MYFLSFFINANQYKFWISSRVTFFIEPSLIANINNLSYKLRQLINVIIITIANKHIDYFSYDRREIAEMLKGGNIQTLIKYLITTLLMFFKTQLMIWVIFI